MAIFSIDVPVAAHATRMVNALCGRYGYQATIPDPTDGTKTVPNPVTKAEFARQQLMAWAKTETLLWEAYQQSQASPPTPIGTA